MVEQSLEIIGVDGVGFDELGGDACGAELAAFEIDGFDVVADDELDAAATDVEDEMRAAVEIGGMLDALIDQTSFIFAADDADAQAELIADALEKVTAVFGFAHGAGGDGDDFFDLPLLGDLLKTAEGNDGAVHGIGGEAPG